jgi:hypothetical protein
VLLEAQFFLLAYRRNLRFAADFLVRRDATSTVSYYSSYHLIVDDTTDLYLARARLLATSSLVLITSTDGWE